MKKIKFVILCLLCLTPFAFGLELYINSGREEGSNFAVLNLVDSQPFACEETLNEYSAVVLIQCHFDNILISKFSKSSTLFFTIDLQSQEKGFTMQITPKKQMKLFNVGIDLKSNGLIPMERNPKSSHWQIVGYEGKIPFLEKQAEEGINFPISFEKTIGYPSIGTLDFQMRPMNNEVGADRDYFLRIQSFIERESFNEALSTIDEMFSLYPDSIFKRDVLYYKTLALDGLNNPDNYEDIVELAKLWLDAYPADIHVPQILYILAKTYANMNFFEEAKYYYDRLFREYKGNRYEYLARLDYADRLYERGDRKLVLELYNSVLSETQEVEVATQAALRLAEFYRHNESPKEAERYLKTIFDANPQYFFKDIPKKYEFLQTWVESNIYNTPAIILEAMLQNTPSDNPEYRNILKDVGIWYDNSGNLPKAHQYYQRFLDEFTKDEEYAQIKALDDLLILRYDELNATKRLEHYDYVLENYAGKDEAKRALEKKAQTLYEEGKHKELFDLREQLEANNTYLLNSVKALTLQSLKDENCKEAAYYGNLFEDKLPLDNEGQLALFDCLFANKQYIPAQKIAALQSQKVKDAKDNEDWLYRLAWAEYELQNYPKSALAARDVVTMSQNPAHNDAAWILFMSLEKLGRKEEAFTLLPTLEEKLGEEDKMIEVYRLVLQDMLAKKDDIAIQSYANNLIKLQTKHQRYEYSPWVELSLSEALIREGKFQEALEQINQAQTRTKTPQEAIQIFYLQGYLNQKLNNPTQALKAYDECSKVEVDSPWKKLCGDAKDLLEQENPPKEQNATQQ